MDGILRRTGPGRSGALLPSQRVQSHAAFLSRDKTGTLTCLWSGGGLEGKADICIHRSTLHNGTRDTAGQLADDPGRSEQTPVLFHAPAGRARLLHSALPGGNQDECVLRMREIGKSPRDLPLPLFRCTAQPGQQWTGSHDAAALAISVDAGESWRQVDVPRSPGCVHMTLVPLGGRRLAAFFRRRQADFVHRSESTDGGESWSVPLPTDVPNNNSPVSASRLIDGRVALLCNPVNAAMHPDRRARLYDELDNDARPPATGGCEPIWGVPRAPVMPSLSSDEGRTFPGRRPIEAGTATCLSNDSRDGRNREMSCPFLGQAADGSLDLAYTFHRRAIKHVRLARDWPEAT